MILIRFSSPFRAACQQTSRADARRRRLRADVKASVLNNTNGRSSRRCCRRARHAAIFHRTPRAHFTAAEPQNRAKSFKIEMLASRHCRQIAFRRIAQDVSDIRPAPLAAQRAAATVAFFARHIIIADCDGRSVLAMSAIYARY